MSSSVKELVDQAIKNEKVVVFSKSYCPYCRRAKQTLQQEANDVKVYELDEMDDGSQIQAYLRQLNGQGTVPHVYIRSQFIGGNDDLQQLSKKDLKARIAGSA